MSFTGNPSADSPRNGNREAGGAVTRDSLAAESIRRGEDFSVNENAAIMGVRGSDSTLNTTDTSAAKALHPARDAAARDKQDFMGLGENEKGHSGVRYPEGAGNPRLGGVYSEQGYVGGPSDTGGALDTSRQGGATGDSFAGGGSGLTSSSSTKTAGISSGSGHIDQRESDGFGQPKGRNLTEGDIPQTKTFTGDVGSKSDPGRLAEQSLWKKNAEGPLAAGNVQYGSSGQDASTGGVYDALSNEPA